MAQKQGKAPVNVLDISSSEDEDIVGAASRSSSSRGQRSQPREKQEQILQNPRPLAASIGATPQKPCLQSQSFWKAGNYEICPSKSAPVHGLLEHARVHPKFLHSNATSHKWAFGAIAELLDNAVDEISSGATYVKVDKIDIMKDNSPALLFQDDGGGMNPEGIRKCMSLGYSSKKTNTTIGQYGNGFKTSTMRLGADVIVFSRATNASRATQSVGLLSYTFLRKTGQDDVIVPMVDFDVSDHWAEPIIFSSQDDWSANLKNILEWSPFRLKEDLMLQFEDIGRHGTKIIIYNLWLNDEGIYELSFDDDEEDIRLRDEARHGSVSRIHKRVLELQSHISYRILYSLRAYASILYLKKFKNFQIILRGKPVQLYSIAEDLKHSKIVIYRPQVGTSKEVAVETTLGFIKEAPTLGVTGFNIYHKNRLIRPFWKVTSDGSSQGYGVVGVLEANFIEPAHDKQDFERSSLFTRLESKLKQLLLEYWRNHRHLLDYHVSNSNMDMAKERSAHSIAGLATTTPKKRPAGQHVHLNQPIGGLASNWGSHLSNVHTGVCRTDVQNELASAQPLLGLAAASGKEVASVDGATVNKLCKENIQLFMRCEEHKQKENELEHMIGELEKELEEAKTKSSHLSMLLEAHRKQKLEEKTWAV